MGLEWVARVPRPPMEDVVKSALGIETEGYTHQLYFRYPLHGGFESIVKAMIKPGTKQRYNYHVKSIRRSGSGWLVSDGERTLSYDHLVLSFPIREAIGCFDDVPLEVTRAVQDLRYNALRVVFLAVNNESLMDKSAVYIPDPAVHPHRVCYMGFFSPYMVKPGTSSLVAEVTVRPGDDVDRMDDESYLDLIVGDLDRAGILREQDVIVRDTRRVEYAYPVYDLDYGKNTTIIRHYFSTLCIDQLGRFAEFDYINSDECIRRALVLANTLNVRVEQPLAIY